jgi:hypothetical protein
VLDGGNIPWNGLATEYGYLTNSMKDYFTTTNQATILNAKLRYEFLVNKYPNLDSNNFLVNGSNSPLYAFKDTPNTSSSHQSSWLLLYAGIGILLNVYFIFRKKKSIKA